MVVNGQRADQVTFNDAFLCKANNETVTGIVTLDNAASAPTVANVQAVINSNLTRLSQNESDIATNRTNIQTNRNDIDSNDVDILDLQTNKENKSEKDQPNGYAGLDANGRISATAVPEGFLQFQGVWDASTNTPTLADGVGEQGDVYRVSVAGTQDLGSGSQTFAAGDWVTYNGSIWERSDFVGASVLSDLGDVDTTGVADGDVLIYNSTNSQFEPGEVSTIAQENIALIGSGDVTWTVNDPGNNLVLFSDPLFISIPGLENFFHSILAQSFAINNDEIAWVTIDRTQTIGNTLSPTIEPITSYVPSNDKIVFLRSFNDEVYVGIHDPLRLSDGDTLPMQKGGGGTLFSVPSPNAIETKFLSSNVTTTTFITDLQFSSLEIGKTYEVNAQFRLAVNASSTINISAFHDGQTIAVLQKQNTATAGSEAERKTMSFKFTATGTTLDFVTNALGGTGFNLVGDGTRGSSYVQVETRNDISGIQVVEPNKALEVNTVTTQILSSNAETNGTVPELTFTGLEPGAWYEVSGNIRMQLDDGGGNAFLSFTITDGATTIESKSFQIAETLDSVTDVVDYGVSFKYQAQTTSLDFSISSAAPSSYIAGNGARGFSYLQLEKRNDLSPVIKPTIVGSEPFSAWLPLPTVNFNNTPSTSPTAEEYRWKQEGNTVTFEARAHYGTVQSNNFVFFDLSATAAPLPTSKRAFPFQSSFTGFGGVGNGGSILAPAGVSFLTSGGGGTSNDVYINAGTFTPFGEFHVKMIYEVV